MQVICVQLRIPGRLAVAENLTQNGISWTEPLDYYLASQFWMKD